MANFYSVITVLLLFVASTEASLAQDSPDAATPGPPRCYFQILNGISPGPVDIYLDGRLIFPSTIAGQRISSLGWPKPKFALRLVDKSSGREKKQQIEIVEGSYATLVLTGDFQPLPDQTNLKPGELPAVRAEIQVLPNKPDGTGVRVRFFNGLVDRPIVVKSRDGKIWTVQPMTLTTADGLPDQLYLQAFLGDSPRSMYLSQQPPSKNLSIVFYPDKEALGFRVMTETTPEGIQTDIKRSQEQDEAEEPEVGVGR